MSKPTAYKINKDRAAVFNFLVTKNPSKNLTNNLVNTTNEESLDSHEIGSNILFPQ